LAPKPPAEGAVVCVMLSVCTLVCPLQMEDTTPPANKTDACRYSQVGVVPCDLPLEMDEDEFNDDMIEMDGDEFEGPVDYAGPPVQPTYVPDTDMGVEDDVGDVGRDVVDDTEVRTRTCYCQAPSSTLPRHYIPCCLPLGTQLATREIQMYPEFRENLLLADNAPPKTQTCRVWSAHRARAHRQAFVEGKWIRVWRGQGHKDTIGWLLITHWDVIKVGDIDKGDCIREGRPDWAPVTFKQTYLGGMDDDDDVIRIQFTFRPCHACVPRS
jgi:hypothetical protein